MTQPEPIAAVHAGGEVSAVQLVIGVLIFIAASFGALLAAGQLGGAGVVIAALIEATTVAALYRWCAA